MTPREFDPASLVAGLVVCGLGVLLLLDQVDAVDLRFGIPARHPRHGGRDHAGDRARRQATLSGPENMADMSAAGHQASQPPLRRDRQSAVVAGVCAGLGRRWGSTRSSCGSFPRRNRGRRARRRALPAGWVAMPAEGERRSGGLRVPALPGGRDSWTVAGGIGLLALALLLVFRQWGLWIGDALVWPVVLAAAGGALIWRQSANAADPAPAREPRPPACGGGSALGRAALGVALVVGAGLLFLYFNDALRPARDVLLPAVVVLVAGTLILAPWWIRLVRGLADERAERVRSQERAELAAHLHDSVLQTLALMQRRAENPREVAGLARRQERELRAWLNGGRRWASAARWRRRSSSPRPRWRRTTASP